MSFEIFEFRNACAEDGVELTPNEAGEFLNAYEVLKDQIKEAIDICPNFYLDLCNRTTEEKLEDLKSLNAQGGKKMNLNDYNELQRTVKKICEIEGYGYA